MRSLAVGLCLVPAMSMATPAEAQEIERLPRPKPGTLVTTEALGAGKVGISMDVGVAVLLPYYGLEAGVGLSDSVDLTARFETVLGVLHFPHVGIRWRFARVGKWRFGTRIQQHYSLFGIQTDQLNLTSTFYTLAEIGISGPVTESSELVFAVQSEFDWFEHRVEDDVSRVVESYRYDATTPRIAFQTPVTEDLLGYVQLRLRIPTEAFVYEAETLYVLPLLGIGGTWTF